MNFSASQWHFQVGDCWAIQSVCSSETLLVMFSRNIRVLFFFPRKHLIFFGVNSHCLAYLNSCIKANIINLLTLLQLCIGYFGPQAQVPHKVLVLKDCLENHFQCLIIF